MHVSPRRPSSESDDHNIDNDDIAVFVVYFEDVNLRFARLGFQKWIPLENDFFYDNNEDIYFRDVVCYKGSVFAVHSNGVLVLCEIDGPSSPEAIDVAPPPPLKYRGGVGIILNKSFKTFQINSNLNFVTP